MHCVTEMKAEERGRASFYLEYLYVENRSSGVAKFSSRGNPKLFGEVGVAGKTVGAGVSLGTVFHGTLSILKEYRALIWNDAHPPIKL